MYKVLGHKRYYQESEESAVAIASSSTYEKAKKQGIEIVRYLSSTKHYSKACVSIRYGDRVVGMVDSKLVCYTYLGKEDSDIIKKLLRALLVSAEYQSRQTVKIVDYEGKPCIHFGSKYLVLDEESYNILERVLHYIKSLTGSDVEYFVFTPSSVNRENDLSVCIVDSDTEVGCLRVSIGIH